MIPERKCASGIALRTALEERLKRVTREEGVDLQRLRRQVAFDRFLARLFPDAGTDWILKGGYAMELRFQTARATTDLDFTVRVAQPGDGDGLLKQLQDAGAKDAGDFFYYRIGEAVMDPRQCSIWWSAVSGRIDHGRAYLRQVPSGCRSW
jgi:Nucleotidyl transferase AbiEii toxin, Type IV TA system